MIQQDADIKHARLMASHCNAMLHVFHVMWEGQRTTRMTLRPLRSGYMSAKPSRAFLARASGNTCSKEAHLGATSCRAGPEKRIRTGMQCTASSRSMTSRGLRRALSQHRQS